MPETKLQPPAGVEVVADEGWRKVSRSGREKGCWVYLPAICLARIGREQASEFRATTWGRRVVLSFRQTSPNEGLTDG